MLGLVRRIVGWRWYASLVLATWVLAPEVRRLVDWQTSFHAFSPFAVLPMLTLAPAILVLPSAWSRIGAAYRRVSLLWFLAFGYAFVIALGSGSTLSALFAMSAFSMPFLLGVVLAAGPEEDISVFYERTAGTILWLAVITSLYGIYQYISPPPWDVYWAQQANIEGSQGVTSAFSFRIFGTLNATGPLSSFLDFAILLSIPRLSPKRWWLSLAIVPCIIALVLTQVRAEWLSLAFGTLVFLIFAPKRRTALLTLGMVAVFFVAIGSGLLAIVSAEGAASTVTNLQSRISTFGSIADDASAISRVGQTDEAMQEAISEPLGQGVGSTGGSTKLSGGTGEEIDNGVVEKLLELGFVGFALYEIALVLGVIFAFMAWRKFVRFGNPVAAGYAAVALAMQLVLCVGEVDADHHVGNTVLFFWLSLFIASAFAPSGMRVASTKRAPLAALTPSPV